MDSSNAGELGVSRDACNVSNETEPCRQHLSGKKHIKPSKRKQWLFQKRSVSDDSTGVYSNTSSAECTDYASNGANQEVQSEGTAEETVKEEGAQEKVTLIDDDKSLVCEVCGTTFFELIQYKLHMSSKSHKRATRRDKLKGLISLCERQRQNSAANTAPQAYSLCTICDKQFAEPEGYFCHMKTKCHKKRVTLQKIFNKINAELTDSEDDAEDEETVKTDDTSQLVIGISGRKRTRSSSSFTKMGDTYVCNYCDKVFTETTPFARHLASKHHEKAKRKNSLLAQLKELLSEDSDDHGSTSDEQDDGRKSAC